MELKLKPVTELRKLKREIDEKLFHLGHRKFDEQEVIEKKIKADLNQKSVELGKEIESRKRKKK